MKTVYGLINRVEKRYDKNIQNTFLLLDNLSAHKSKMVKEEISKCIPRIKSIFLPVSSEYQLNRSKMVMVTCYKGRQLTILHLKVKRKLVERLASGRIVITKIMAAITDVLQ